MRSIDTYKILSEILMALSLVMFAVAYTEISASGRLYEDSPSLWIMGFSVLCTAFNFVHYHFFVPKRTKR